MHNTIPVPGCAWERETLCELMLLHFREEVIAIILYHFISFTNNTRTGKSELTFPAGTLFNELMMAWMDQNSTYGGKSTNTNTEIDASARIQ